MGGNQSSECFGKNIEVANFDFREEEDQEQEAEIKWRERELDHRKEIGENKRSNCPT